MTKHLAALAIAMNLMGCGDKGAKREIVTSAQLPPAAVPVEASPKETREVWSGTVVLPADLRDIVVTFIKRDGAMTATLDVPALALTGIALADVALEPAEIRFTVVKPAEPAANEHFVFTREGATARGTLTVGGQPFVTKLVKLAAGETPRPAVARPQTPKPPYPYTEREVTIEAPEAGVLAGTLTIPTGKGPFPAVVLISGSGQQDRDETIFGHRPFRVMADRLTRDGFVVLRTDDRGTGKTKGAIGSLETDTGDGRAAFEWLAKQPEVNAKRVGVIGHSVGGIVAPTIAARTQRVAFVVALAGPGVSGAELIPLQIEGMMLAAKMPAAVAARIAKAQRTLGVAIVKGEPKAIRAALKASIVEALAATSQPALADTVLEAVVEQKLVEVNNPWTVSFFKTDPAVAWRKVKCPVLAVIGDKDLQVPADVNLAATAKALKAAGNRDVTMTKRPGLNHLYQHATTGAVSEYGELEETFDVETLDLIATWLSTKAK
ncbi:MAG: alpha/beta fold hydrolase [Deltaproteobacteria bacterium]|nr:alpha/beta fold hydrolase [Deltaproteobacteria bacterium]